MARDVTLRATYDELVGDETYEVWLKHESDAWGLEDTGDVVPDDDHQDFVLLGLTAGDDYIAQLRLKRAGRYRTGYLTSDPDTWPEGSRAEFTPGALEDAGAPEITDGVWARTSSSATNTTLTVNPDPDSLTLDIKILRDGVEIGTISAPHAGDGLTFVDTDPPLGSDHEYIAAHTAGFLDGPSSSPFHVFGGPLAPTSFVRVTASDAYGTYEVSWDDLGSGYKYRLQDDFLCPAVYTAVIGPPGTMTGGSLEVHAESTEIPVGDTQAVAFHCRIRAEVTAFTITDVSGYEVVLIEMLIEADNPDYSTCP